LRAPAAGLVTEVHTAVGAPASPQAGPMFRISINNEVEMDAEVPSIQMLKLNPGAPARISRDDAPDLVGRVRLVSPQVDRATQLGHVRVSLTNSPSLKVGMFARANIDAKRSCGVAIPHTAIDHLTVQVVKGNTVETRNVRVGLVCLVGLIVLSDALLYFGGYPLVTPFQVQSYTTAAAAGWLAALLFGAIIVAPAGEEILFRGFLFRGWARSNRTARPAIVVISILWAALHVQYDWTGILQIFVIGLFVGWIRWRSGSTLLTFLLHALFNLEATIETALQIRFFS